MLRPITGPRPGSTDTDAVASVPTGRLARPQRAGHQLTWGYVFPIAAVHLLASLASIPWLFSWAGLWLLVAGIYFFGCLGINLCYHRLLTHRSFKCPAWLERTLVVIAVCCLEDAPASWVTAHRLHHRDSDHQPDPHSPLAGFFWSHVGWLLVANSDVRSLSAYDRYARDILRTPFYFWLERPQRVMLIYLAHAWLFFLAGLVTGLMRQGSWSAGLQFGASLLVWGVFLRTAVVWHVTWSVNSLSHVFGYRTYKTDENSRNNWLVALLASGEGWHNNHHAEPASASNWHRWWEVDLIYLIICALERVGLAWDVIRPRHVRHRT